MILIDGNFGEGGGSIVRIALALSTITQQPFEVKGIRKGRKVPGLKAQHLYGIRALGELSGATSEGAALGSESLKFFPGRLQGRTISIDIGTAGSITLLLQSVLLPSLFANAKVRLKLTGGTDVQWSPSIDYFCNVLLPHIRNFCENIEVNVLQRGYFPRGGGKVEVKITPKFKIDGFPEFHEFLQHLLAQEKSIELSDQQNLLMIKGISHASKDLEQAKVAERQASAARASLGSLMVPVQIRSEYANALSTGSGITIWAIFSSRKDEIDTAHPMALGSDALGERGKRAEEIGRDAAKKLLHENEQKVVCDRHLADMLIPYLALFGGSLRTSEITNHTLTNIYVCEQFLGKRFNVDEQKKTINSVTS
ncbi:RNA 3'-terminal phosphate cyclase [Candidatus Woesearchaeota archaeon]|nr:RNA 3'-terminal phosphate cyclase [Candidatus Woesearchaeota archaeon]